jgi:hypothetical protein
MAYRRIKSHAGTILNLGTSALFVVSCVPVRRFDFYTQDTLVKSGFPSLLWRMSMSDEQAIMKFAHDHGKFIPRGRYMDTTKAVYYSSLYSYFLDSPIGNSFKTFDPASDDDTIRA